MFNIVFSPINGEKNEQKIKIKTRYTFHNSRFFGISLSTNMVKWTQKVLRYIKTVFFGVKGLKVVARRYLHWISFHDDLCRYVHEYSNVEDQVQIFNTYH